MSDATPLTLADISDQRAYERERDEFRRTVIAVKKLRRVSIGPVITATFENRLTMRFQVQEMARAERMFSDQQIQGELDIYNRLLPAHGELSATLFLELTSDSQLREWLPKLVGIERAVEFRIGRPGSADVVPSVPEADHASHLTREAVTSAVHYIRFRFTEAQVDAFAEGPVVLAVVHPLYPEGAEGTELSTASRAELLGDLRGP
ncbi:MAG: DUF3501 family protein [Acidimicrobiales bacterium]